VHAAHCWLLLHLLTFSLYGCPSTTSGACREQEGKGNKSALILAAARPRVLLIPALLPKSPPLIHLVSALTESQWRLTLPPTPPHPHFTHHVRPGPHRLCQVVPANQPGQGKQNGLYALDLLTSLPIFLASRGGLAGACYTMTLCVSRRCSASNVLLHNSAYPLLAWCLCLPPPPPHTHPHPNSPT
jgi:hypothetical protein